MTRSEDTSIRVSVVGGVSKNSQSSAVVKLIRLLLFPSFPRCP